MDAPKRTAALVAAAVVIAALAACASASPEPAAPTPTAGRSPTSTASAPPAVDSAAEFEEAWAAAAEEARPGPVPELLNTTPIPVGEYVARFRDDSGWLDSLEAVQAEYRQAAQVFPLALPEGYAFPEESWLRGDDGGSWQRGAGVVQAYLFWQMATATAAFHDHVRGDHEAATVHLDALTEGRDSPVRAMFIEDPGRSYIEQTVAPAYEGDFDRLYTEDANEFLRWPDYAAVSAHAGDWEFLGSEGYAVAAE